jgi:predicted transcriptional regulator of viral defense system
MVKIDIQEFTKSLPRVFDEATFIQSLDVFAKEHSLPKTTYKRILKSPTLIQLHWNKKTIRALYTFKSDYSFLDLLSAWTSRKSYLSHYSALYFNGLVDQQPKEHFISSEARTHSNSQSNDLNLSLLRQSFMKAHKSQQNFCFFDGLKFHFIEKANLNNIGIYKHTLSTVGLEIPLNVTNIERTLIDSVVAPQYSGGMDNVRAAFKKAEINIQQMALFYGGMRFLYPYWQTIGLILELTKGLEIADQWLAMFGVPKVDFYYDRNYRSDWTFNKKWRLYSPTGVVNGN